MTALPTVAGIALGGTIAAVPDETGKGAVPQLSAEQLVAAVPQLEERAHLRLSTLRRSPSGDLTFPDIVELAEIVEDSTADGVVITQGTDVLEETSFLLSLIVATDKPVVLTGAMRNPALPGADGPANLLAAVNVATSREAHGLGPLVVFADEVHLPRFVRKTHSSSVAAFESPMTGPIGWIVEEKVRIPIVPRRRRPLAAPSELAGRNPDVIIMTLGMGTQPLPVDLLERFDGVVLGVYGGGHVPARCVASIEDLARRVPVVMASRTGAGELYERTYDFPGSEADLLGRGVISAGALDPLKARALLSVLLARGDSEDSVREEFGRIS